MEGEPKFKPKKDTDVGYGPRLEVEGYDGDIKYGAEFDEDGKKRMNAKVDDVSEVEGGLEEGGRRVRQQESEEPLLESELGTDRKGLRSLLSKFGVPLNDSADKEYEVGLSDRSNVSTVFSADTLKRATRIVLMAAAMATPNKGAEAFKVDGDSDLHNYNEVPAESDIGWEVPPDAFEREVLKQLEALDPADVRLILKNATEVKVTDNEKEYSIKEYIEKVLDDWLEKTDDGVHPAAKEALVEYAKGLGPQESKLDPNAESPNDAKGVFQFMVGTWTELGGKEEDIYSPKEQVDKLPDHLTLLYKRLNTHLSEEKLNLLRKVFLDDEDYFQRDFMALLTLNAHNPGAKGMSGVVEAYVDRMPVEDMALGRELIIDIAEFGRGANGSKLLEKYGDEAADFVPLVCSKALLFDNPSAK